MDFLVHSLIILYHRVLVTYFWAFGTLLGFLGKSVGAGESRWWRYHRVGYAAAGTPQFRNTPMQYRCTH